MVLFQRIYKLAVSSIRNYQVTLIGAANEIGQSVSLQLRSEPGITKLVVHDMLPETAGVVLDVSHIPTESALHGFSGDDTLESALKNSAIVIATGGALLTPGLSKQSCFVTNVDFIRNVAKRVAMTGSMPFFGIATEPINCLVPMAAEVMMNHGTYDGKKLFGITGYDALRAQCMYAMEHNLKTDACVVPVIGGHSDKTMIPLLSQAKPYFVKSEKQAQEFTLKVQKGNDIVTLAKRGWSPTLSVAYGVVLFVRGILSALQGYPSKVNAYVENNDFGTSFFSGLVSVTQNGTYAMERFNSLSKYEIQLLERSIKQLRKDVSKGRKVLELA